MSPGPPEHLPDCQAYRKAWRERYGSCTARVCCCARIRGDELDELDD